jgi:hypothetical protein
MIQNPRDYESQGISEPSLGPLNNNNMFNNKFFFCHTQRLFTKNVK